MKLLFNFALLLTAAVQLQGCASMFSVGSSEYGCKGMPEGVTCKSAREVYDITEADDYRAKLDAKQHGASEEKAVAVAEEIAPQATHDPSLAVPLPARNPLPIRTQATVMRIWVAPWESADGDLNVPGYVYTEIEPRRWELGVSAPESQPTLRPLQVSTTTRVQSSEPAAANNAAPSKAQSAVEAVSNSMRGMQQNH